MTRIFEDFLKYCSQDNTELRKDIETWIADYFDLPNRLIRLNKEDREWINENLSVKEQVRILGMRADNFNAWFRERNKE